MRTSLTRAVAGVAIAAATAAAVVGVASAASAGTAPKGTTTLSIVEAKNAITVGQADAIGGVLKSHATPLANRIIVIDRWVAKTKKWQPIEEKFTGKFGGVSFSVAPRVSTAYKLVFPGGEFYYGTHSGTVVVVVRPVVVKTPTSLSIAESAPSITLGGTDTISGALTADSKALPKQWVWLAVVTGDKVHAVKAFRTNAAGEVAFKVKPTVSTTYELFFLGTGKLARSASGTVTTTVTPAPAA